MFLLVINYLTVMCLGSMGASLKAGKKMGGFDFDYDITVMLHYSTHAFIPQFKTTLETQAYTQKHF